MLKGKIELAGNAPAAAFNAFVNAAALDPSNLEAQHGVVLTGLQTNHPRETEAAATTLLALNPHDPVATFAAGVLALRRDLYPEAMAAADKVLAQQPGNSMARVLKIRALFLAGQRDAAGKALQQANPFAGNAPELALIALEVARANRQPAEMIKAFEALRRLKALTPQLSLDEANVRFKSGDRAGADRLVSASLAAAKTTPDMVRSLVGLWREYGPPLGPVDLAASSSAAAREEVARFLTESNRGKDAVGVLALAPSPNAEGIKALALLNQGQETAAADLARRVIAGDAGQCEARLVLARVSLRARAFQEAVLDGTRALSECPSLTDAAQTLALAYGALHQDTEIVRVYRETIAHNPESQRAAAAYVAWLRSRQQTDRAETTARRLTRAAPSRPSSWRLLATTCTGEPCRSEAKAGLAAATQAYRLDRRPGEPPRTDLFAPLPLAE